MTEEKPTEQTTEEKVIEILQNVKNLILDFKTLQQKSISEINSNYSKLQRLPLDEIQHLYESSPEVKALLVEIDKIEKEL
ncbi:hypothetical protein [Chryseobacterium salviniae]|uniref:Uncharacterized protein n=1 Tax=Chryseobacterium salviniae TaxID=3101750 RepID=A0ABU6HTE6_9FLAO|nr:hypothetical protein [Chryseobacterium sp. T9W2-O]MEC3875966.1 hypothetical protein [Chryseobacterium sp. T9W2-O]